MTSRRVDDHRQFDVDLASFDRLNLWPMASGEMALRPGLRKLHSFASTSKVIASRSIKHPHSEETWHYVVDYSTADGCVVRIFDESFASIQVYDTGIDSEPIAASITVVNNQVCVTSPSFATAWGWLGDSLTQATPLDSVNELNTPSIPIPAGISAEWGSRLVVGRGSVLFISDPGAPRTFIGNNALVGEWSSEIYGVHVTDSGLLCVVTASGVWALPEDAASTQVVIGQWSKMTDYTAVDFGNTATSRGELWGLTRRGLRRLIPSSDEMRIADQKIPRKHGPRVSLQDFREATLIGGQDGPIVSTRDRAFMMDLSQQHGSWWSDPNESVFRLAGTLLDTHGGEMLVSTGDVYRVEGNFDGGEAATSEYATAVTGGFAGRVEQPAAATAVVRRVRFGVDGSTVKVSVRSTEKTASPNRNGIIIGTDSWGAGNTYEDADIEPTETQHNVRCQEMTLEVMTERPLTRVGGSVDLRALVQERVSS